MPTDSAENHTSARVSSFLGAWNRILGARARLSRAAAPHPILTVVSVLTPPAEHTRELLCLPHPPPAAPRRNNPRNKPPRAYLYLDGLSGLFLSKLRDAHVAFGRVADPALVTSVQQSWVWKRPRAYPPLRAPGLRWSPHGGERVGLEGSRPGGEARAAGGRGGGGPGVAGGDRAAREASVWKILGDIAGGGDGVLLWGPSEVSRVPASLEPALSVGGVAGGVLME